MICDKERSRIEKERKTERNLQVTERHGIVVREKFYRFMQGRYGGDQFNRFLMILALFCFALSLLGAGFFYVLGIGLLIYAYFRMLSKNIYKRREENAAYMRYEYRARQRFATWKRDMSQRGTHHIYKCPSCKQKIRIPRGKGKIEVRCPKCGRTFIKRS